MNSKNIEILIKDYMDGKLTDSQSIELLKKLQKEGSTIISLDELVELNSQMDKIDIPEPSSKMSNEFYANLNAQSDSRVKPNTSFPEIISNEGLYFLDGYIKHVLNLIRGSEALKWSARLAFAMILVIVGWMLGQSDGHKVDLLRSEMSEMQKMFSVSMLKDHSPSKRIQALQYITRFDQLNYELRRSVFDILNRDPNVNVRLEALETILLYTEDKKIRQNLVLSISMQSQPMMQMAMAEAMVSLREKRAIIPLKKLLLQKDLNYSARSLIMQSISALS